MIRQMFEHESCTFTYLLFDKKSKDCILLDPVKETVSRDLKVIGDLGLNLKYIIDTHVHADHITGAGEIREITGAKTVVGENTNVACADIHIKDNEKIAFGGCKLRAIATPGHTSGCMSYHIGNAVFTGDSLLIGGNGRTDFQGGSAEKLYHSITERLFTLPKTTTVYPGHNYIGLQISTIAEEMQHNPRIGQEKSKNDFINLMKNLKLPKPKQIIKSIPANLECGSIDED